MPAPSSLDGLSVLVIDDDEAIRIAICELLAGWGCLCRAVDSEAEALAVSDSFTPDLLLADYRLRGDRTACKPPKRSARAWAGRCRPSSSPATPPPTACATCIQKGKRCCTNPWWPRRCRPPCSPRCASTAGAVGAGAGLKPAGRRHRISDLRDVQRLADHEGAGQREQQHQRMQVGRTEAPYPAGQRVADTLLRGAPYQHGGQQHAGRNRRAFEVGHLVAAGRGCSAVTLKRASRLTPQQTK